MPLSTILLGSLALVSIIVTILVIFSYRFRKEMTREKFALRVFVMIASLASTLTIILLTGHTAIAGLVGGIEHLFGGKSTPYEPALSDKLLGVTILLLLIFFALRLHRNWHGDISIREHEATNVGLKPRLLTGAFAALSAYQQKTALEPYRPSSPRRGTLALPPPLPPSETKAWHSWVARSLTLIEPHFRIDEIGDWYPEAKMFISKYGTKNSPIAILCVDQIPTDSEVSSAIDFANSEVDSIIRLIVAVNGLGTRTEVAKFSVSLEFRFRSELLDCLVNFDAYRADIRYRYEAAAVADGYPLTLEDVYVPSEGYGRKDNKDVPIPNVEDYLLSWVAETGIRQLAVLGERLIPLRPGTPLVVACGAWLW